MADSHEVTPLPEVVYCPGCNELLPAVNGTCSRCGVRLSLDSSDQNGATHLIQDAGSAADIPATDPIKDLTGSELDLYSIEALIGSGGMGRVYLAKHRTLQRSCALKLLSPRSAQIDAGYIERFQNEGRASAAAGPSQYRYGPRDRPGGGIALSGNGIRSRPLTPAIDTG